MASLVAKESTPIEKISSKPPLLQTSYHSPNSPLVVDAKKNILAKWRQMRIVKQRKDARLNLDSIKNTAGFNDNMEAMRDFEKLIGCKSLSHPTIRH
ncbi:hypothetical protein Lal_00036216 [Lupinus albus]|uniref:Uncharacterized protein n=1 Tax=Lupinus albus TaxID=3870 RepID=A0A6A4QLE7_LUPAL|nr:hypothetical protein Lalb_Chr04g0248631 [Lupinus albus]KAF1868778.1 hypothetical protein Lal_00036216 [Lupinus albus]